VITGRLRAGRRCKPNPSGRWPAPGPRRWPSWHPAGTPVLAQTERSAGGVPPEEEFGQGLAIVLRGLRAMLAEPSPLTREQP
jgi:hypothetical protein